MYVRNEVVIDAQTGAASKKNKKDAETVLASPTLNKTSTVVKQFVVDYTTETFEPLMEHEVNGIDYKYVYGNDRLSVNITGITSGAGGILENGEIRLYYHMDLRGTADYLTSPVSGKIESWTHYNEWGEITHNTVVKCGQRELDLVMRYATHDYDQVLNLYYAKARFYDAENRRFTAEDPIKDGLNWYAYCENNPVIYIDPTGLILSGTVLTNGAKGDDVASLNAKLFTLGYISYHDYIATVENYGFFGSITSAAVKQLQKDLELKQTGNVNSALWKQIGFQTNTTIAQEFFSGKRGNETISVTVNGNNIMISYSPKIYVQDEFYRTEKRRHGNYEYFVTITCTQTAEQAVYDKYTKLIVEGFKKWAGTYTVQGVTATVSVNVNPTQVSKSSAANLVVTTNRPSAPMVTSTVGWSTSTIPNMELNFGWETFDTDRDTRIVRTSTHEFGHVLGLFDAYGYYSHWKRYGFGWLADEWLPEAAASKAPSYGVMRSPYFDEPIITGTEIEMMLYAWSRNELQIYEDNVLGTTSQAFYR